MFNRLFGKKPPVADPWTIETAEDNGLPIIMRYRSIPPPGIEKASFPSMIAIQWLYDSDTGSGFPSPDVKQKMDKLEDLLDRALESTGVAINTAIITGNGVREWQWYAKDHDETMRLVNIALSKEPVFPITFHIQNDPSWSAYEGIRSTAT